MSFANMITVDMKTFREDMRILLTRAAFGHPIVVNLGNDQYVTLKGLEKQEIGNNNNQQESL